MQYLGVGELSKVPFSPFSSSIPLLQKYQPFFFICLSALSVEYLFLSQASQTK